MKDPTDKVTLDMFEKGNNMGKFKDLEIEMMEKFEENFNIIPTEEVNENHEALAWEIESILNSYNIEDIVVLFSSDTKEKLFKCLLEYMDD